jgi:hypothetical protein
VLDALRQAMVAYRIYAPRREHTCPTYHQKSLTAGEQTGDGYSYDPYANFEDFRAIKEARLREAAASAEAQRGGGAGRRASAAKRGTAFGVGALEEDDADVYAGGGEKSSRANFHFEVAGSESDDDRPTRGPAPRRPDTVRRV